MKTLFCFFLLVLSFTSFGQSPTLTWQKTYGGSGDEFAHDMEPTPDGGYILCGTSKSNDFDVSGHHGSPNVNDCWIVKIGVNGEKEWAKTFGGSGEDVAKSVIPTSDGGYAVAGYTRSTDGDVTGNLGGTDMWVLKLDESGGLDWQKTLGGSGLDEASAILESTLGLMVLGTTYSHDGHSTSNHPGNDSDILLVVVDMDGSPLASTCFGGSNGETGLDIKFAQTEGLILTGYTRSNDGDVNGHHGNNDFWVVKTDGFGDIEWTKCYGGSESDIANSVIPTSDGGYLVAGKTISFSGDVSGLHYDGITFRHDYWVIKISSTGTLEWQHPLGGNDEEEAFSVIEAASGGYIVAGVSESFGGDVVGIPHGFNEFWLVKLSEGGGIVWEKSLGGGLNETATSIAQLPNGSLAVAGYANSTDGQVSGLHGSSNAWDFWMVKLGQDITGTEEVLEASRHGFEIFPNPAKGQISIRARVEDFGRPFVLSNSQGKAVLCGKIDSQPVSLSHLTPGLYYFASPGARSKSQKVIIQ